MSGTEQRLAGLAHEIKSALEDAAASCSREAAIDGIQEHARTLLHLAAGYDRHRLYTVFPAAFETAYAALKRDLHEAHHCLAKFTLLKGGSKLIGSEAYNARSLGVRLFILRNLQRMSAQAAAEPARYYTFANDRFVKDFAIVIGRLAPIGSFLVEGGAGIPRSILLKGGARQCASVLKMWFEVGRLKPFYQSHLNLNDLEFFNREGSELFYLLVAEEMARDACIRGYMRSNWFIDPAVAQMSPHLAHFSQTPLEHGAYRFLVRWDLEGKSGALATSRTRRRRFESGEYVPAYYMMVWPRGRMISWYEAHGKVLANSSIAVGGDTYALA